jgi:hypothetical protein
VVPGQPQQKKFVRSHLNRKKLGMVLGTCYPSYREKLKIERLRSRPDWAKIKTLYPK